MKNYLSFVLMTLVMAVVSLFVSVETSAAETLDAGGVPELSCEDASRVHELAEKVSPAVREKFIGLHDEWYKAAELSSEIRLSSSIDARTSLPQFAAIVEMGREILPLVVEQMLDKEKFFTLTVYEAIVGKNENSSEADCRKQACAYVKDWLASN